ncbi:cation transporter [Sinomonas sp. ASV322]|uniref:cation transporter n=1 Tax=Sinomonas sp. ASV322 TaxID=3041920 RepID=UPI0027DB703F|nr:cation transporter [Sinomonas sp. ASV322]MDQ4500763.1 cation transporter [Sinomonas sp. ASV322]
MNSVPSPAATRDARLLRTGLRLEYTTLAWNVVEVGFIAYAAVQAGSPALAGFGLDTLIEIFASLVVVWELKGTHREREARAVRLIGFAFAALALYLTAQVIVALVSGARPGASLLGIAWTALTVVVMLALAWGKQRTGRLMGNPVLIKEGKVTLIDGCLAAAVMIGLVLNGLFGWWWADPAAGAVVIVYAAREAWETLRS